MSQANKTKNNVSVGVVLNKTYEVNVLFKTLQKVNQDLYYSDPDFYDMDYELYEFSRITLSLIPFINSRLSDCEEELPEEGLSKREAIAIQEEPGIESQFQENLEIAIPLVIKIAPQVSEKKDLLIILEMLCRLYCIGALFLEINNQNDRLFDLLEKLGQVNNFINEKIKVYFDEES